MVRGYRGIVIIIILVWNFENFRPGWVYTTRDTQKGGSPRSQRALSPLKLSRPSKSATIAMRSTLAMLAMGLDVMPKNLLVALSMKRFQSAM